MKKPLALSALGVVFLAAGFFLISGRAEGDDRLLAWIIFAGGAVTTVAGSTVAWFRKRGKELIRVK